MGNLYQINFRPINLAQVATSGISNWGCLPFEEQYGPWKFLTMNPLTILLAQTVNSALTISLFGAVPLLSIGTLQTLRDGTIHHLRQMLAEQDSH